MKAESPLYRRAYRPTQSEKNELLRSLQRIKSAADKNLKPQNEVEGTGAKKLAREFPAEFFDFFEVDEANVEKSLLP